MKHMAASPELLQPPDAGSVGWWLKHIGRITERRAAPRAVALLGTCALPPIAPRRRRMRTLEVERVHRRDQAGEFGEPDAGQDASLQSRDHGLMDPGRAQHVTLRPAECHPTSLHRGPEEVPAALDVW